MTEAEELFKALDNAFISSWQRVSWAKELEDAINYLERNNHDQQHHKN